MDNRESGGRRPGEGGAAYRDEAEAARARVQALARELADAQQQLEAVERRAEPPTNLLETGLRLVFWSKVAHATIGVLSLFAVPRLLSPPLFFWALDFAYVGASLLAIIGVLRLLHAASPTQGRPLLQWALAGHIGAGTLGLFNMALNVAGSHFGTPVFFIIQSLVWRAVAIAADGALLLFYVRIARRLERRILRHVALVTSALFVSYQLLSIASTVLGLRPTTAPLLTQLRWSVGLGVEVLVAICAGLAMRAAATAPTVTADSSSADTSEAVKADPRWTKAAAGLRLHRAGVLAKVLVALLGALLLMGSVAARSLETSRALMVLVLIAGLVGSVLAVVGLARFASVPDAGSRSLAIPAVMLAIAGILVDLWTGVVVVSALSGGDSLALVQRAQSLEPVTLALSLPSLLLLLLALRRLALNRDAKDLARRATQLSVLVGIITPLAVVMKSPSILRELGPALIAIAVPLLGLAIYVLARYVGLLRSVANLLDHRPY